VPAHRPGTCLIGPIILCQNKVDVLVRSAKSIKNEDMTSGNGHIGLRSHLNARFMAAVEPCMDSVYGSRKRSLFSELPAEVVEIGAGAGANMRYFPAGTHIIAIEPNPRMHPFLNRQARRFHLDLDIRTIKAEAIDLPDASARAVVATLVLCSVANPEQVISEIRRILKPGGRFIFLEHVAAPEKSLLGRWQKWLHKPWHYLSEGCHLHRNSHSLVAEAGFEHVEMDCFLLSPGLPFRPHICGTAHR
jgi:SAM-dependent methyltransferase